MEKQLKKEPVSVPEIFGISSNKKEKMETLLDSWGKKNKPKKK